MKAKIEELRNLSSDEMEQKVASLKHELFQLRMQMAGGKLDKPHRMRAIRQNVARLSTWIRQEKSKKGT